MKRTLKHTGLVEGGVPATRAEPGYPRKRPPPRAETQTSVGKAHPWLTEW